MRTSALKLLLAVLFFGTSLNAFSSGPQEPVSLDGEWEITALIDDGELFSIKSVKESLIKDARLKISGQTISFVKPGTSNEKKLIFVTNSKVSPATVDIGGTEKTSGKGIYMVSSDTLLVCLSGHGVTVRPTSFASDAKSDTMLMTLKRVQSSPSAPAPAPAKEKFSDDKLKKMIVGTWGHQTSERVEYYTFNGDGSFSAIRTWKRGIRKLFDEDSRSSGTWKVLDGVVIVSVSKSTDRDLQGQVFSYRINSITDTDVIYLTADGQVRREWKTK